MTEKTLLVVDFGWQVFDVHVSVWLNCGEIWGGLVGFVKVEFE